MRKRFYTLKNEERKVQFMVLRTTGRKNDAPWIDKTLFTVETPGGKLNLFSQMIPALCESIGVQLIGTVSTALISEYSQQAVVALGAANTVIAFLLLLVMVISVGGSIVICQNIGADRTEDAAAASGTAISLCLGVGILLGWGTASFAKPIMTAMNLTGTSLQYGITYFRIRMLCLPLVAVTNPITAIMRCNGYPKCTLVVGFVNSILNYLLCLAVLRLNVFPTVSGVTGVALANITSQLIALLTAIFFLKGLRIAIKLPRHSAEWLQKAKAVFRIGIPSAISEGSFTLGQIVITSFLGKIGDTALAAKVYFSNIFAYTYLFGYQLGQANAILVGRLFGFGDYERADRMTRQLHKITLPVNISLSLLAFILRVPILSGFTDNPDIFALAMPVMLIDLVAEIARGFSHVSEYSLRGTGDVTFIMAATVTSCWCCSIGLGYLFGIVLHWGLVGIWVAVAIDESIRAIVTVSRWNSKKWYTVKQKKNRI